MVIFFAGVLFADTIFEFCKFISFADLNILLDVRPSTCPALSFCSYYIGKSQHTKSKTFSYFLGTTVSDEQVENITTKARDFETINEAITTFSDSANFLDLKKKKDCLYGGIKREKIKFQSEKKQLRGSIPVDESESFGKILSCFEGKKLNLRKIMDWPVTSKPYAVAAEDGKICSNSKSLLRNYLQLLCPVKPSNTAPVTIRTSVVDAMRVVRMIPVQDVDPPTFLSWAKNVFSYIHGLPGDVLHIVFDIYSPIHDPTKVISKGRVDRGFERKILSLNQTLPNVDEWQGFLTNERNKDQICNLLADYFTSDELVTTKKIYVTKGRQCFVKPLGGDRQEVEELYSTHREADHR